MKPVVVFALTFAVALAGSTGAKVLLTKPPVTPPPEAGSSANAADSTHADTAVVASGQPAAAPPVDTARAPVAVVDSAKQLASAVPSPAATTPAPALAPTPAPALAPEPAPTKTATPTLAEPTVSAPKKSAVKAPLDTATEASQRRVAKVFTSMDAKQAAKVLEHMADGDVQIILGYVGTRQAASILAALPPERVATLSKLALQGRKQ